jgi:predicted RNA-binding protein with TRAM domain
MAAVSRSIVHDCDSSHKHDGQGDQLRPCAVHKRSSCAKGPEMTKPSQTGIQARTREVTIERIVPGGLGLARVDGKVVLTPLTAPGDRVRIRIVRDQERVAFGDVVEVTEPGSSRVEPPCPYYARCGGCDFQHLDYESQLQSKVEMTRDSFRRIAGIELNDVPIVPSPEQWRYRTRAEWRHDAEHGRFGYFAAGSHDVVDVADCLVASPALGSALTTLRLEVASQQLPKEIESVEAAESDGRVSMLPPAAGMRTRELARQIGSSPIGMTPRASFRPTPASCPRWSMRQCDSPSHDRNR